MKVEKQWCDIDSSEEEKKVIKLTTVDFIATNFHYHYECLEHTNHSNKNHSKNPKGCIKNYFQPKIAIPQEYDRDYIKNVNKLLYYYGCKIYHSQDKHYYQLKEKKVKTSFLFKTVFREDEDDNVYNHSAIKEYKVSSIPDVIICQRLNDKSLKLELKNFAKHKIEKPFTFSTSFKFDYFSTHVENHKLAKAIQKSEFYRQSIIPDLGSYDSDNENNTKTLKYSWEKICFKKMNENIKQLFKGQKLNIKSNEEIEEVNEIVSLLFIAETSRNPITYLMAPMFLELLADKILTIKNISFFPMSMKKAVAGSRALSKNNELFGDFKYDYFRGENTAQESLMKSQVNLFIKWGQHKKCLSSIETVTDSLNKLTNDWYNIDCKYDIQVIGNTMDIEEF